jgi:hypothetical protein
MIKSDANRDNITALFGQFSAFCDQLKSAHEDAIDALHSAIDKIEETLPPAQGRKIKFGKPPEAPIAVECWHCRERYSSDQMIFERRLRYRRSEIEAGIELPADMNGLWWCRNYECDGAGYGVDLHEVQDKRVKVGTSHDRGTTT